MPLSIKNILVLPNMMKKWKNSTVTRIGGSITSLRFISLATVRNAEGREQMTCGQPRNFNEEDQANQSIAESSVSFPYRVDPILASHSHIIPWVLPKKLVTLQISDSHGPGKMSHLMLL